MSYVVKIPNDRCCPEIDHWLNQYAGNNNYTEVFHVADMRSTNWPYRHFVFYDDALAILFALRWA